MKKVAFLSLAVWVFSTPIYQDLMFTWKNISSNIINTISIQNPIVEVKKNDKANIQVALLLDTSNSMDGLIDQAKSQLWKMVNELATAKKGEAAPNIEIALYHYGNSNLRAEEGYVKQITPLTSDLDLVSERLFELRTSGGDEYCGWVIGDALTDLDWSGSNDDLKIIIIAGNEPFSQGPKDFRASCKAAISKGIIVNTIHCGDYQNGIKDFWKEGADLADGQYMNINQDDQVVHIPTPFDDEILRLNSELNKTYIGFGSTGKLQAERQMAQDANAASYGAANARTRASFKAKQSYNNASWDLVDAAEAEDFDIAEVEEEALPEEMKDMNIEERGEYIQEQKQKRDNIQKEILGLEEKAKAYEMEERKKNAEALTLDNVMINTVKEQAKEKKFKF